MAKHEIEISVKGGGGAGGGRGASRTESNLSELKEQMQRAKLLEEQRKSTTSGGVMGVEKRYIKELETTIKTLINTNKQLEKALRARGGAGAGSGSGSGSGESGTGMSKGMGGSMAAVGTSIAFAGAIIGALGYAWQKISQVGHAYLAKAQEQLGTTGIAGYQAGAAGYYRGSEMGQMVKERAMAVGKWVDKNARYSLAPAMEYGKMFGMSGQEVGKQVGIFDLLSEGGSSGGFTMKKLMGIGETGKMATQTHTLIGSIATELEEAVKNGVTNSDLAEDMAREIAVVNSRLNVGDKTIMPSIHAAMAVQKGLMDTQRGVARGDYSSLGNMMMMQISQQNVRNMLESGDKQNPFIKRAIDYGLLNESQLGAGAKKMDPAQLKVLTELYNEEMPGQARQQFVNRLMTSFGGTGSDEEKRARALNIAKVYGISGFDTTAKSALYTKGMTNVTGNFNLNEIPAYRDKEIEQASNKFLGRMKTGPAFEAAGMDIGLENTLMNVGKSSANAVVNFNNRMMELAQTSAPLIDGIVGKFDEGMQLMLTAVNGLVTGIANFAKDVETKGFGGAIKDMINPF